MKIKIWKLSFVQFYDSNTLRRSRHKVRFCNSCEIATLISKRSSVGARAMKESDSLNWKLKTPPPPPLCPTLSPSSKISNQNAIRPLCTRLLWRIWVLWGCTIGMAGWRDRPFLTDGIRDIPFLAGGMRDSQGAAGSGFDKIQQRDTGLNF